jgi:hypothetical protein
LLAPLVFGALVFPALPALLLLDSSFGDVLLQLVGEPLDLVLLSTQPTNE